MKRKAGKALALVLAILTVCVLAGCSPFQRKLDTTVYDEEEMKELAMQIVLYMAEDDYDPILAMVNETVADAITKEVLENANEQMRLKGGYFVKFGKVQVTGDKGDDEPLCKVTVTAQHGKRAFTYTLIFNTEKKIVSLYLI